MFLTIWLIFHFGGLITMCAIDPKGLVAAKHGPIPERPEQ